MTNSHKRMMKDHAWPAIGHNRSDILTHLGTVALDGAVLAKPLVLMRTPAGSFGCIRDHFGAMIAKAVLAR